jgi:tRNA 2-thiouridine synthesizing protein A
MADHTLDCKGLSCPMPIVKISKAAKGLSPGETLAAESDDPAFQADLEAWIRKTGNKLVEFTEGDVCHAIIKKA